MEVAVRDAVLNPGNLEELAKGLGELGIRSFELWINKDFTTKWGEPLDGEEKQAAFAKRVKDLKLKICAGCVETHLANEDSQSEIEYTVNASRLLSVFGVKTLRIDVVAHEPEKEPRPWQEYLHRAIKAVKESLDRTQDIGIEFAVENHGTISNRLEFLRGLHKGVDSPRLGHTLDTGNFYWYGYPLSKVYEILEEFAPLTKHTHFKNINYPQETREQERKKGWGYEKYVSPLAEGDIDLGRVVGFLKKAKFKNDLCIEDESLGELSPEEKISILKKDVELLKSLL